MTSYENPWTFRPPLAELRCRAVAARVDVSRPDLGLHQVQLHEHKLSGRLLCVRRADAATDEPAPPENGWPSTVADAYVRGNDLVASYQPRDDWPYAPQIYWCADSLRATPGLVDSLSLLVSVETHLLDTWPRIGVRSQLACQEMLHVAPGGGESARCLLLQREHTLPPSAGACCLLWRPAAAPVSYAEFMPAGDFRTVRAWQDGADHCAAEWELFGDFLEKGVIRRARLQCAFLPRDNDVQLALKCCEAIEREPLPLTT